MKLHKVSRSWAQELEFRRLVSDAAAQFTSTLNQQSAATDDPSHNQRPAFQAHILPLDEQGRTGASRQIEVKDFDERGITFQHQRPLHDRRALVVLEGPNQTRIAAEVDLSWCRFTQRGQYTSGGRFVGLVGLTA